MLEPVTQIKSHIQSAANHFGYAIKRYPELDQYLQTFLGKFEVNCVLDVGAHTGEYYRILRSIGYKHRIISFEPSRASYRELQAAAGHDPLWTGFNIGLSDSDTDTEINVYSRSEFNSLYELDDEARRSYHLDPGAPLKERITLRRLDNVLSECLPALGDARIFMKIDTQGHDLAVVKGTEAFRDRLCGIQSELAGVRVYGNIPLMHEALAFYCSIGFVPSYFGAVNTFSTTMVTPEWDVIFRRKPDRLAEL